jgi:hypothetical protein
LSQLNWIPELPQEKLPVHGPLVSALSHAPPLLVLDTLLHAATTKARGTESERKDRRPNDMVGSNPRGPMGPAE